MKKRPFGPAVEGLEDRLVLDCSSLGHVASQLVQAAHAVDVPPGEVVSLAAQGIPQFGRTVSFLAQNPELIVPTVNAFLASQGRAPVNITC
jgi:hypothetical protein